MNYSEIEDIIKRTLTTIPPENGWINLTKVGIILRKKGIRYVKLTKLLQNFTHIIEFKKEESLQPPIHFIRLK